MKTVTLDAQCKGLHGTVLRSAQVHMLVPRRAMMCSASSLAAGGRAGRGAHPAARVWVGVQVRGRLLASAARCSRAPCGLGPLQLTLHPRLAFMTLRPN